VFILIDKVQKAVVYRHEKPEVLRALVHIELAHHATSIFEETNISAWEVFAVHNLQELFKSLTGGTNPHSADPKYLIGQLIRLCQTTPVANVDGFGVTVQALGIKAKDKDYYRYIKGESKPRSLEDPYNPPPLLGNWKAAQGLPLAPSTNAPQTPIQATTVADSYTTAQTPPKYAPPWAK
jgi:hypothetical protein